ncbi:MAG TPA: trigger factor [Clostridiales bacterium]|nr:trigger factor [Clostridiales bacterium]
MSSKLQSLENNTAILEIEVDAEKFAEGMQKSYLKNRSKFNIPGFRKGRAPKKLVEAYYGEAVFYEDAIKYVYPESYQQAIEEHGLEPVDQPEIEIESIGQGQSLVYKAKVVVKPDVQLGQYKGIEAERVVYGVNDKDVDEELENIRQRNARLVTVEDRAVEKGDVVTIDYKGFIEGEEFEGGTAENQNLEIGSNRFVPGFEEQLIGAKIGDQRDVKVTFPEDYFAKELAGKEAVFEVKVNEIKMKELPELDDEFAKDVSEYDTLDEYKKHIREKLEENAQSRTNFEYENKVVEQVTKNAKVDIPEVMVERQIDIIMRDFSMRLMYQGITLDKYLEHIGTSMEDFRAQYKDEAYNRVKTQLVLEKIAKVENIQPSDEDVEEEIKKLAEQYQKDPEEFKKTLQEQDYEHIKDGIRVQKTIDLIVNESKPILKGE